MRETEKLLAVQELDVRIRDMERELKDIPARKAEEEGRLNEHKEALSVAQSQLKTRQAQLKELELENEGCLGKIQKFRQQQMQLKTNKEFKAMETEVEAVKTEITGLEDRELALMEQIEAARQDVSTREKDLAEEDAAVREDVGVLAARVQDIESEIAQVRNEREEAARDVSRDWLERYDIVMTRRDRALVPLQDGVCGGCHMKLPPYVLHATRRGTDMVTCDWCGRLVY